MKLAKHHFVSINSTNDYAKELLGDAGITIVTADYQTSGRGRNGNEWHGEFAKNLYLSVGLNHDITPAFNKLFLYQIIGCLSVYDYLKEHTTLDIIVKYPNDIKVKKDDKYFKISGVMAEHSFVGSKCKSSVIGIGLNVLQREFPNSVKQLATSLEIEGYKVKIEELADIISQKVVDYLNIDENAILEIWKERLDLIGKKINIQNSNQSWFVKDFTDDGRLICVNIDEDETRYIDNGDKILYA